MPGKFQLAHGFHLLSPLFSLQRFSLFTLNKNLAMLIYFNEKKYIYMYMGCKGK